MSTIEVLSDRALDAWLAERLFGLVECSFPECREEVEGHDHYHFPGYGWGSWKRADLYSSTGDGMLLVVEAMRERGWWFSVEEYGIEGPHQCVEFTHHPDDSEEDGIEWPTGIATALTPGSFPRAVCEAAKAALEAGHEDAHRG